jgi:hypothetical protein
MRKLRAQGIRQQDRFAPNLASKTVLPSRPPINPVRANLRNILSTLAAMYRIPSVHPLSATGNGSERRDRLARY